jgi:hypothetical protein
MLTHQPCTGHCQQHAKATGYQVPGGCSIEFDRILVDSTMGTFVAWDCFRSSHQASSGHCNTGALSCLLNRPLRCNPSSQLEIKCTRSMTQVPGQRP